MSSDPRLPNVQPPPPAVAVNANPVIGAIRKAAQATGASFEHLLATAKIESDLNPNLSMRSSSATGLFQFIEQTWLETLKTAGRALGYGRYADSIKQMPSGRYVVADPGLRHEIMKLRKDPTANAVMGAAFTQQNEALVSKRIGRKPTEGELYVAHFFGAYTGAKVINQAASNPNANAAAMFPAAARANRPIFYDKQGHARSIAGVYAELVRRYQVARASTAPGIAPAAVASAPAATPAPAAPDTAGIANAFAAADAPSRTPPDHGVGDIFHSLFQDGGRRTAVSPKLAQLWTGQTSEPGAAGPSNLTSTPAGGADASGGPLDLFQELRPNVRALFDGSA